MSQNENTFTRGLKRIGKLLGVSFPEDMPEQNASKQVDLMLHTPTEMRYLPGIYAPNNATNSGNGLSTPEFLSQLLTVSQQAGNWSRTAQSLNILAPEIGDAGNIFISSVISPTDLQTDSLQLQLDSTDLGPEIETKISTIATDYFNDTFELAPKAYNWLFRAWAQDGATAIMLTPQSNINTLNQAVDIDEINAGNDIKDIVKNANNPTTDAGVMPGALSAGMEVLKELSKPTVVYDATNASMEVLLPDEKKDKETYDRLVSQIDSEIDLGFEALAQENKSFEGFIKNEEILTTTKDARKAIRELFSSTKNSVVISSDVRLIDKGERFKKASKIMEAKVAQHFMFDNNSPTFLLDTELEPGLKQHPTAIELPYGAVVPVIIPGAPDKHLGYFVLTNQWGTPLNDHVYDRSTANGPRKLTEGGMQAVFGQPGAYKYTAGVNDDQRFKAATMMFGITLKNLLNNKLEEYGFGGATIEEHEAVSMCLFRHLLDRKKVGLIFVPEGMMTYIAFDYHSDGTGKAKIEDLSTLLSLRTVLLVSGVMAATENAIDNKTIEVDIDEKNVNVVQYLSMIRDAFIEKKMLRFDNEPLTVQRDLLQRSLTILPKNMKGLREGLSVNTEHKSTGSITPDTGFMEQLTNWIITGLGVPHAAMNQLSEAEYSRSVATTNLFFNNKVKSAQRVAAKFLTKFVRAYIKYSTPLQEQFMEVLKVTDKARKDLKLSNEAEGSPESKEKIKTNKATINKKLATIIQNIRVTLPAPQIVVDKAQYEELERYVGAIDKVLDSIFNDNQIMDTDSKDMFTMFKATVRADMVRDYIKQVGFQSSFDIPYPKDLNLNNARDLYQYVVNQKLGFDNFKKYVVDKARKHLEENPTDFGMGDAGGENPDATGTEEGMGGEPTGDDANIDQAFDQLEEGNTEGATASGGEEGGEEQPPAEPQDADFDNTPPPPSF